MRQDKDEMEAEKRQVKNKLVSVGGFGDWLVYLNIDKEVALARYLDFYKNDPYLHPETIQIDEIYFDDAFHSEGVWAIWSDSDED